MTTATDEFVDYYLILTVAETVDAEAIKKAIREQRRVWNKHAGLPDPVKRTLAEKRIRDLAAAERELLDPARRKSFDERRRTHRPTNATPSGGDTGTRDWLAMAREYFANGNPHSANYAAREAISVNGANHEAWSIRANASFQMGKFGDAEYEFNEAIRLQPDNSDYHFDLAEAFAAVGGWGKALASYELALRLSPGNPVYKTAIANVYIQNNDPQRALNLMEEVVRDHPELPVFQYYLALALHDVNLTKWGTTSANRWIIISEAQIAITREMSGRALKLNFDDAPLRASLEDNLRLANAAAETAWFHSNIGGWLIALVIGLGMIANNGIGIPIVAVVIFGYFKTHNMPRWKHNSKQLGIKSRGI